MLGNKQQSKHKQILNINNKREKIMSTTKVLNELECVTSAGILADSSQIRYKDSTTIRNTLDTIISESSGNTITVKYAKYASTDTSKGTIE